MALFTPGVTNYSDPTTSGAHTWQYNLSQTTACDWLSASSLYMQINMFVFLSAETKCAAVFNMSGQHAGTNRHAFHTKTEITVSKNVPNLQKVPNY